MAIPNWTSGKYQPAGLWQLLGFPETTDQLLTEPGYTTLGINGIAHRRTWASIEPSPGVYNWSYVDAAAALAVQMGKRFSLLVSTGVDSPPWVFATPGMTVFASTDVLVTSTGNLNTGFPQITGLSSTAGIYPGSFVTGTGIPVNATVLTVDSGNQVTMNMNATVTGPETISFGEIYPAPWDLNYQAVLNPFIQAFASRYDTNPFFAYVVMSGWGRDNSMAFCSSLADNAALAATTYNGVTGNALWSNAYLQILQLWQNAFRATKLISNYFGVQYPQVDTLSIAAANAGKAQAGNQYGIKWNNTVPGPPDQHEQTPFAFMLANSATNPAGYQMQHADPADYTPAHLTVQANLGWFMEIYKSQITANRNQLNGDNNAFIDYVNSLTAVPFTH